MLIEMGWFDKKDDFITECLLKISSSVSRTESNVENLKDGLSNHLKAETELRKIERLWQRNIEEKAERCSEKKRVDEIEKKQNQDIGKAHAWKIVAAMITAITATALTLINLFRWKPWN